MTVAELIARLQKCQMDQEIMINDAFNGNGCPRTINLGPVTRAIRTADADDSADCEGRVGENIVVIGFGCY